MHLTGRAHKAWGQLCSHHAAFTAAKVRRRAAGEQEPQTFWPSVSNGRAVSTETPRNAAELPVNIAEHALFTEMDLWASRTYQKQLEQRLVALYDASTFRVETKDPSLPTAQQIDKLQQNLGYHFRCLKLLKLALLHHSVSEAASNSLSWVGDTVLQTVITEQLALHQQSFSVAKLSPIRSVLVSRTVLARHAQEVGVHQCAALAAHLNRTALAQGHSQLLAEMLEAIFGAIYVDGGFSAVRRVNATKWPLPDDLNAVLSGAGK